MSALRITVPCIIWAQEDGGIELTTISSVGEKWLRPLYYPTTTTTSTPTMYRPPPPPSHTTPPAPYRTIHWSLVVPANAELTWSDRQMNVCHLHQISTRFSCWQWSARTARLPSPHIGCKQHPASRPASLPNSRWAWAVWSLFSGHCTRLKRSDRWFAVTSLKHTRTHARTRARTHTHTHTLSSTFVILQIIQLWTEN